MDLGLATLTSKTLDAIGGHADALLSGSITADQFREQMARTLITNQAASFMLGKGDRRLDLADQRIVTDANKRQLSFLDRFVEQIKAGDYEGLDKQLRARAALYAGPNKELYSRGQTRGLDLPGYPADGMTPCLVNCACSWEIEGDNAYWRLGATEHCTGCIDRAAKWNPYQMR